MDERVLLVEEDASIREVVGIGLRQSGMRPTGVADGRDALAQFREGTYDVVLLDVMLPSLDSFEVLREIRRQSRVPVVMLTARTETVDVVVGLELGADDYVTTRLSALGSRAFGEGTEAGSLFRVGWQAG